MEFTGVHKEDLVKLLKNLKNDHHLILGILFESLIECRHKWICDSVQVVVPLSSWDCLSSFLDWACYLRSAEDYFQLDKVMGLMDMWDEAQIFDRIFSDQLKSFIRPKMDIIRQRQLAAEGQGSLLLHNAQQTL